MIDTGLETDDPAQVLDESKEKNAQVALLLTAAATDAGTLLKQKLFWVSDGTLFDEMNAEVDVAYSKEMKFGEEFFFCAEVGKYVLDILNFFQIIWVIAG